MVLNGEVLQSAKKPGHSFFARCLAGTFAGEDPIGSHVAAHCCLVTLVVRCFQLRCEAILIITYYNWLVIWNMWIMTFHSVGNGTIIPTDELHHFSEGWLNHQPDTVDIDNFC